MKNKYSLVTGMLLLMVMAAGCGTKEAKGPENVPAVVTESIQDTEKTESGEEIEPERKEDTGERTEPEGKEDTGKGEGHIIVPDEGEEHLGGSVRSVGDNSVIVSKIFVEENGNSDIVYLPGEGSQDEELVTVNFADGAEFQYWVIQGGGGNIDMRESSFSEIKEDSHLEMYGNYDGDTFIASKVIIEVYE